MDRGAQHVMTINHNLQCSETAGRGPWYLSLTKALNVGLSKEYFRSLGLPSLFEDC